MWNKGSYDVSNKQFANSHLSVVLSADDQHGQNTITLEKNEPAWNRLKWILRIQERLTIWLMCALFLIIFVLIGVIIWLSVSIHLNNRENIRTISTAMGLLISHNFKQNAKLEHYSTDGIESDIGQSCGFSCAEILKATFDFPEDEITDSEKSSLPNRQYGTATIQSSPIESFPSLETSRRAKSSSCNNSEIILEKFSVNKIGETRSAENDSVEDSSDEEDEIMND
ncbi:uncharacterized protein LOC130687619 isoform X2 [Daphnia carinata]|uniref:uncharacterized protein LOC130687619 isoform X2 n=1 Tax=Daphnia carinata TaxID=120202 RepID=UPI00257D0A53|nr:uncharacterized protein LOC130687619 isoform X2 [Daphnia carinata]